MTPTLTREELDALKASVPILEFLTAQGLKVRREGRGYKAHCPFHEDRTASFSIHPKKGLWNCFSCGEGGDHLTFLRLQGQAFPDSIRSLQSWTGAPPDEEPERRSEIIPPELLPRVAELYHHALAEHPEALAYLQQRGLTNLEMLRTFQVGFCAGRLPYNDHDEKALLALGVLNEKGRETLTGCITVPLRNRHNHIVGMYGRRIKPGGPDHRMLAGTSQGWFYPVLGASFILVVEGVLDALACYQAGFGNVVALGGAQGLTPPLRQFLQQHSEVVLCLDSDAAGEQGTQELTQTFTEMGLACRSVKLPVKDPAQFFLEFPASQFAALLQRPSTQRGELDKGEVGFLIEHWSFRAKTLTSGESRVRTRVVIEDTETGRALSDTCDLRSRKSRRELARAAQERWPRLSSPEEQLERLLELLEALQAPEEPLAAEVVVTPQERAQTQAYLQDPCLFRALLHDFEALGYVGEEENKVLVYLISLSRFLPKPLSAIILSGSGAGKSFVAELAERLTPPEGVEFYSRLSTLALAFMGEYEIQGKLILLEERAGGEAADYSIRTLQSKLRIVQALPIKDPKTGKIKTVRNVVYGPIAYIETTTNPNLNPENTSRCFLIHLDESREQTARIQERQRRARSLSELGRIDVAAIEKRHHLIQRVLEPLPVVIPFAEHLTFSDHFLRNRRDNERLLSLLEVVAFLHQFQRPRRVHAGQEYIEATLDDYRITYWLAQKVLLPAVDELSRWGRELLTYFQEQPDQAWSRRHLRQILSWPDHRLREALEELTRFEHLLVCRGAHNLFQYRLNLDGDGAQAAQLGLIAPDQLEKLMKS